MRQSLLLQATHAAADEHIESDVNNSEGSDFEVDRIGRELEFKDSIVVARRREHRQGRVRNRGRGRSLSLSMTRRACGVLRRAATVGEQLDLKPPNEEKPDILIFTGGAGLGRKVQAGDSCLDYFSLSLFDGIIDTLVDETILIILVYLFFDNSRKLQNSDLAL